MTLRTVIFILVLGVIMLVSCGRKVTPSPTLLPIPTPTSSPPTAQTIYSKAIHEMGNVTSFQASGRFQEESEAVFFELRLVIPDNFLLDFTEIQKEIDVTVSLLSINGTNVMRSAGSDEWFIDTGKSEKAIRVNRTAAIVKTLLSEGWKRSSPDWSFQGMDKIGGVKTYHLALTLASTPEILSEKKNDILNNGILDLWIGTQDFLVYKISFVDSINYHEVVFTLTEFDQISLEFPQNLGLLEEVEVGPAVGSSTIRESFEENQSIAAIDKRVYLPDTPEIDEGPSVTTTVISTILESLEENQTMPTIDESVDIPQTPEEVRIFLESLAGPDQVCIRLAIGKEPYAELLMGNRMPTLEELLTASLCLPSTEVSETIID